MRALLRAGGEVEGSAMHHQLAWLVGQYVQVDLGARCPPHAGLLTYAAMLSTVMRTNKRSRIFDEKAADPDAMPSADEGAPVWLRERRLRGVHHGVRAADRRPVRPRPGGRRAAQAGAR